jgi:ATP-dependent Zn protease
MDRDSAFVNLGVLSEKLNIPLASVEKSVKSLAVEIYDEVVQIIESNKEKVEKIARLLMEKEIIHEEELISII